MNVNGNGLPATRADVGMRLVVAADNYRTIGILMDEIGEAVEQILTRHHTTAEFDFTHFNTYPCKTMRMEQVAEQAVEYTQIWGGDGEEPAAPSHALTQR